MQLRGGGELIIVGGPGKAGATDIKFAGAKQRVDELKQAADFHGVEGIAVFYDVAGLSNKNTELRLRELIEHAQYVLGPRNVIQFTNR